MTAEEARKEMARFSQRVLKKVTTWSWRKKSS
jgi:hypothetical protein